MIFIPPPPSRAVGARGGWREKRVDAFLHRVHTLCYVMSPLRGLEKSETAKSLAEFLVLCPNM